MDDVAKLKHWSKHHYMHYRHLLLPDHVCVYYLLCSHPTVIEHSKNTANHNPEDQQACERLIKKLMVTVEVVDGAEREILEDHLIDTFFSELLLRSDGTLASKRVMFAAVSTNAVVL